MAADGQRTNWCRNIAENFNRLSRVHETYRQTTDRQTDGRPMTYSGHELEFTFAKNPGKILRRSSQGHPYVGKSHIYELLGGIKLGNSPNAATPRNFTEFGIAFGADYVEVFEDTPILSAFGTVGHLLTSR